MKGFGCRPLQNLAASLEGPASESRRERNGREAGFPKLLYAMRISASPSALRRAAAKVFTYLIRLASLGSMKSKFPITWPPRLCVLQRARRSPAPPPDLTRHLTEPQASVSWRGGTYEPDESGYLHVPAHAVAEIASHGFIVVSDEEVSS